MTPPPSASIGQVVVLVERWPDPVPPAELPLRGAMRPGARAVFVVLLLLATVAGAGAIVLLWTTPTPGLWFSLLFTVLIAALVVVLWVVHVGSLAYSAERVRAHARWRGAAGRIDRLDGTVRARTVSTIEDGGVDRFELVVDTAEGPLLAAWERATARSPMLLQTQVPGVGARARIWRIREAGADAPLVIEVRDPSVVSPAADPL
ncbi:MAG: hypothetical protein B7X41_15960 [Microbacterium sp. 14-71-5]|jgi:hypothetical protein|uniref:hypothetical protein n=1 Tax=Microbacterium sp. 13-71-7 TaxID=1970399 RepID=UPI000BD8E072|nr:hypothetical protein [Microbacterium sp. 13-71-7]OZB82661.1 MAG: hypothetical protein B7X41_15960 [Microbacterium sp. 14-71-5]OZB84218.1 MAG: hypothetical protein B7X32_07775 [Microbacterium sp. 13-71-7]